MNNKYYKTDFEGLVKDPDSGAVLNVDNVKLEAYKKHKLALEASSKNVERINKEKLINDSFNCKYSK